MTGYNDLLRIRRIEEHATKMGFRMAFPSYGYRYDDGVALIPADDHWPIFARDANVFVGTLEEAENWLNGIEWGFNYLKMLRVTTDQKIARKEQDYRNTVLAATLATNEKEGNND